MNTLDKKQTSDLGQVVNSAVNDIYAMLSVGTTLKDHIKPVMEKHFGSDSNGDWNRRMAYDICETALTKFIHIYGKVIHDKANGNHQVVLDLLDTVETLMPTEYVRSEEQIELQQFSTPISIAYIAYLASGLQPNDVVCEPSAGTGLLGAFPKALGNSVLVNEYSDFRVECLNAVYDKTYVYDKDAKYLADIEPTMRGDVVIMNPPFARDMDGKSSKTMIMHIDNALALLPDGGRLVVITGVGFVSSNPKLTNFFAGLKQKVDIVYSGILPTNSFGKHGTSVDTKITVIEKGCLGVPHISDKDSSTLIDFINTLVMSVPARRKIANAVAPVFTNNIDLFQDNKNIGSDIYSHKNENLVISSRKLVGSSGKFSANGEIVDVSYTCDVPVFSNEDDGMYHEYLPQVLNIDGALGLIEAEADINAKGNNGSTALILAVMKNKKPDIITKLIDAGADINAKNIDGGTTLIEAEADINAKNTYGYTALMLVVVVLLLVLWAVYIGSAIVGIYSLFTFNLAGFFSCLILNIISKIFIDGIGESRRNI